MVTISSLMSRLRAGKIPPRRSPAGCAARAAGPRSALAQASGRPIGEPLAPRVAGDGEPGEQRPADAGDVRHRAPAGPECPSESGQRLAAPSVAQVLHCRADVQIAEGERSHGGDLARQSRLAEHLVEHALAAHETPLEARGVEGGRVPGVGADPDQDAIDEAHAVVAGDAQRQVPVLAEQHGLVPRADALEAGAPEDAGDRDGVVCVEQAEEGVGGELERESSRSTGAPSVAVDVLAAPVHQAHLRVGVQHRYRRREQIRQPDVVGVVARDVLAARQRQPGVQCRRDAAVRPAHVAQARVGDARKPVGGIVGGAVVDDDQLQVGEGLSQDALDRLLDVRCAVVRRQQDGDPGDLAVRSRRRCVRCGHGALRGVDFPPRRGLATRPRFLVNSVATPRSHVQGAGARCQSAVRRPGGARSGARRAALH